jgi:hypothetical protein
VELFALPLFKLEEHVLLEPQLQPVFLNVDSKDIASIVNVLLYSLFLLEIPQFQLPLLPHLLLKCVPLVLLMLQERLLTSVFKLQLPETLEMPGLLDMQLLTINVKSPHTKLMEPLPILNQTPSVDIMLMPTSTVDTNLEMPSLLTFYHYPKPSTPPPTLNAIQQLFNVMQSK